MNTSAPGRLLIVSGPSGAGKSTLVRRLIEICPLPIQVSVSATTRPRRKGETDGVDYHFLPAHEFQRRREAGEFLECKEVFGRGHWYGTLKGGVESALAAGKWVLLEIDVQGALSVLQSHAAALTFFVHPGTMEELERRLTQRGTEDAESLRRRLEVASGEMALRSRYTYEIVNDDLNRAAQEMSDTLVSISEIDPA